MKISLHLFRAMGGQLAKTRQENSNTALLVERCNQGDRRAWNEFYARYGELVSRSLAKRVQVSQDELEDLVQEVFVELIKALKTYDPSRPIEAFIFEIARRVGISRYRKITAAKRGGPDARRVSVNPHDSPGEPGLITPVNPGRNQEDALLAAQESQLLRHALRTLSSKCRDLIGMRYERGLSYKEMASHLESTEGALRTALQRCLVKLAEACSVHGLREVERA